MLDEARRRDGHAGEGDLVAEDGRRLYSIGSASRRFFSALPVAGLLITGVAAHRPNPPPPVNPLTVCPAEIDAQGSIGQVGAVVLASVEGRLLPVGVVLVADVPVHAPA